MSVPRGVRHYGVVELHHDYSGGTRYRGDLGNAASESDFSYDGGSTIPGANPSFFTGFPKPQSFSMPFAQCVGEAAVMPAIITLSGNF